MSGVKRARVDALVLLGEPPLDLDDADFHVCVPREGESQRTQRKGKRGTSAPVVRP